MEVWRSMNHVTTRRMEAMESGRVALRHAEKARKTQTDSDRRRSHGLGRWQFVFRGTKNDPHGAGGRRVLGCTCRDTPRISRKPFRPVHGCAPMLFNFAGLHLTPTTLAKLCSKMIDMSGVGHSVGGARCILPHSIRIGAGIAALECMRYRAGGLYAECWQNRREDCAKFFTDPQRPRHCFSCVAEAQNTETEPYCEEVQTARGTLQDRDARLIVLEVPRFWKLSQARNEKPDTVRAACDLLRCPRLARFLRKAAAARGRRGWAGSVKRTATAVEASTLSKATTNGTQKGNKPPTTVQKDAETYQATAANEGNGQEDAKEWRQLNGATSNEGNGQEDAKEWRQLAPRAGTHLTQNSRAKVWGLYLLCASSGMALMTFGQLAAFNLFAYAPRNAPLSLGEVGGMCVAGSCAIFIEGAATVLGAITKMIEGLRTSTHQNRTRWDCCYWAKMVTEAVKVNAYENQGSYVLKVLRQHRETQRAHEDTFTIPKMDMTTGIDSAKNEVGQCVYLPPASQLAAQGRGQLLSLFLLQVGALAVHGQQAPTGGEVSEIVPQWRGGKWSKKELIDFGLRFRERRSPCWWAQLRQQRRVAGCAPSNLEVPKKRRPGGP
eukprot:g6040.t1